MFVLGRDDENLQGLIGKDVPSELAESTSYRPELLLGKGGGSVAFLAKRMTPRGEAPVVLKVLRPAFVRKLGEKAHLLIRKEAVALGRLNERVPPTPFVIRLVDTGTVTVVRDDEPISLPWVAVEYVHGGALGTTLAQRVRRSLRDTGYAFDPGRARTAIECIGHGLAAVHEVLVIHRDVTPNNILCSGRGADEVFKIADFGVARPSGVSGTLTGSLVGTPGFAAPELSLGQEVGTHTDVFSFASMIFYLLTGEPMFTSMAEILRTLETGRRRSLAEMPGLHPELRQNEKAVKAIDLVLGWATAAKPSSRLAEALALSSMVTPHLPQRREHSFSTIPRPHDTGLVEPDGYVWNTLHKPGSSLVIRSVAWDGHGRAIAASAQGLSFWNGTAWKVATTEGLRLSGGVRFVQRVGAGRWIMGGDSAEIAIYTTGGAVELVDGPRGAVRVEAFCGDLEDISVLATQDDQGVCCLNTFSAKRWLRPLRLPDVAAITTLVRFDDTRWLVAGREKGGAFAALYSALDWEFRPLTSRTVARAYLAGASRPRKTLGYLGGTHGVLLTLDGDRESVETIGSESPITALALDPFGRPWVATQSRILMRDDIRGWITVWQDTSIEVPIISLFLDAGLAIAMTADGAIVEGRGQTRPGTEFPRAPGAPKI